MMNHKLGIIVPYRNRYEQLLMFKRHIIRYMIDKNIDYELIVVGQDDGKAFNRGKLLNIGFLYAEKYHCDYIVFHDLDMLPKEVDYSYFDIPLHLATNLKNEDGTERDIFPEYFGGVTLFPTEYFKLVNGYSNNYWGWGYEDTDLLYRCKLAKIPLNNQEIEMKGGNTAALRFNGKNAFVKSKNIFNFRNKTTIFISFYPDEFDLTWYKKEDVFAAFGLPGFDCIISYNSYSRYTFEIFNSRKEIIHIHSNIKTNHKTTIAITIDIETNEISMYQDGELVGTQTFERIYNYNKEKHFYLGCADAERNDEGKFFKGCINSFAIFDGILKREEIEELSNNKYYGLTQNFNRYKSDYKLMLYYDMKVIKQYKLIDLSGNGNDGEINNCEIVGYSTEDYKVIEVPYRRESIFDLMPHEENGFVSRGWVHDTTRYNQLRFYNEVEKGYVDTKNDGLNTCDFKEFGISKVDNITEIMVGI